MCVDHSGRVVMEFNSQGMFRGWAGRYTTSAEHSSAADVGVDAGAGGGSDAVENEMVVVVRGQIGIWSELIEVPLTAAMAGPLPALVTPNDTVLVEVAATDASAMQRIGQLRYAVWEQENSINKDMFPDQCWVDGLDKEVRSKCSAPILDHI